MFNEHISHGKKAFSLVFMACLIAGAMIFVSCGQTVGYDADPALQPRSLLAGITANPPAGLNGGWTNVYDPDSGSYDGYDFAIGGTIDTAAYNLVDLSSGTPNDYGLSFTAVIIDTEYAPGSSTSGVMVIKFSTAPYDANADEFSAIYFKNLTASSVQLANASELLSGATYRVTAVRTTQAAALLDFTWANINTYTDPNYWVTYN